MDNIVEYLNWLKVNNKNVEFDNAYPNSVVFRSKFYLDGDNTNEEEYLTQKYYENYPVVGVSQIQARKYCIWLQDSLNKLFKENSKYEIEEVIVRLPSIVEWITAAKSGLQENAIFPWEGNQAKWRKEGKKR